MPYLAAAPYGQGETHLPLKPENLVVVAIVRGELPWVRSAIVSGGRIRPAIGERGRCAMTSRLVSARRPRARTVERRQLRPDRRCGSGAMTGGGSREEIDRRRPWRGGKP